ncbi:tRNA guanosine(34) transglycosylase Tgt [Candidatus Kaiserbacteria bacterium]|nr:tRNA guanosine(34) transglycosylase Tgt [Candidatus Kaiserbacteria bacterium]
MFEFKILKRSKKSRARLGVITTPHGEIETPAFVPVATRATVRTLESDEVAAAGSQVLICNTYHLHTAPGEKNVKRAGGLHHFMQWKRPLMTDSGGFQVFSLGFGKDHGVGKILKEEPERRIPEGTQPTHIKITDDGVHFRSPIDGTELYLSPKESIRIQEALGADIMFAFDECPSPLADEDYLHTSLERTHRWAAQCLKVRKTSQALYGIVQGGGFKNMRIESARLIGALPFEGFGVGGEFGYDKRSLQKMLEHVHDELPENKPRHVLGVGHPEDFPYIAGAGGDTFDCIAPTHYARRGTIFTSKGRLQIRNQRHLTDQKPLDPTCSCDICKTYSRAYISHLMRAYELTGMKLASYHNLHFFNAQATLLRKRIQNGEI